MALIKGSKLNQVVYLLFKSPSGVDALRKMVVSSRDGVPYDGPKSYDRKCYIEISHALSAKDI